MDLAILEMNKLCIEKHFSKNSIDINEIFARLKWADKNEQKLKGTSLPSTENLKIFIKTVN